MTHPRLSVSEMCTYPVPFADELEVWDRLGVRHVGVTTAKVADYGRDKAIAALKERSIVVATLITGSFELSAPESWDDSRERINDAIDLAGEVGGVVYTTSGRRVPGRSFDQLTASLTDAFAPCVEYAAGHGVPLAIEPSLRTDVSYVHTLRDGLDVVRRAGLTLIADLGNCWAERDYEQTLRGAGADIAAVQFADALWGTRAEPSPGGRIVPGEGDLDIAAFLQAALDAGYTGPFELELVGPMIEKEGHVAALERAVARANTLLEEVDP